MSDIRWQQRFENFKTAFKQLEEAVLLAKGRGLSNLEKQGLIKAFEFTYELAWNVMKDYFEFQGTVGLMGSRDTIREAFKRGLISDGDSWMEMLKSRNQTSHTYNQKIADEIIDRVKTTYFDLFSDLKSKILTLK